MSDILANCSDASWVIAAEIYWGNDWPSTYPLGQDEDQANMRRLADIISKHVPPGVHPSVRGEKSVHGLAILDAIRELCKGDAGEDAYIRIYPADARIINKAIGGCDIGAPEPEIGVTESSHARPESKP